MTVYRRRFEVPRLTGEELAAWSEVPTALASDCLNRAQAMVGRIGPLAPGMRIVGQARTVECMVGDNSALHGAIGLCEVGDVLVCDAQGFEDTALFGGLLTRAALAQGIAGLVIDGAVRDSREIIDLGLPCFARAVVPRGPHKGFGGTIDGPITCGGVALSPGDLVIGDADGVAVVPFASVARTLRAVREIVAKEERALASLQQGGSLAEVYGVPKVELID